MASRHQQAPTRRVLSSTLVLAGLLTGSTVGSAQAEVPDGAPGLQGEMLAEVAYTSRPAAVSPRPNIVVLMLDDIGAIDDRVWERLPTIRKRFLQQGIKATQFHVEIPTCTPGRVGFLTGLHTHHHQVTRNVGSLFRPSLSIATQLRKRGYYTVLGGKYLNGYESITPKVPPGWSEFHAMTSGYYDYDIWSNGVRQHRGKDARDYSTDVVARKITASLTRAPKNKPVFIWAAPWAAHQPRIPAPRHKDDPRCYGIDRWKPPGGSASSRSPIA